MRTTQLAELVIQALEHEAGGVNIYETAVTCALNEDLKKEWAGYLKQTRAHVDTLHTVCEAMGIDPSAETPGREIVRQNGVALVEAMMKALESGDEAAAELVACDCVVLAETKDHANWELLARCAERATGPAAHALKLACEAIGDEEDEHLVHARGWCRELWLQSLGLPAVVPPAEPKQRVKAAIARRPP